MIFKILIFINVVGFSIFIINRKIHNFPGRLIGLLSVASISMYSGLGILMYQMEIEFLLYFSLYLLAFSLVFSLLPLKDINTHMNIGIMKKKNAYKIANTLGYFYLLIYFLYLVVPENKLYLLVNPPRMNISDIVEKTINVNSGLTGIFSLFQSLLLPFFFILLYKCWIKKQRVLTIFLIFSDFYLNMLKYSYFGRTDVMISILLLVLITSYNPKTQIRTRIREWKIYRNLIISVMCIAPFLFTYIYSRIDTNAPLLSFWGKISGLMTSEFYYPKHYYYILQRNIRISVFEYLKWFFTLPIPKAVIPINIVTINANFTNYLLGTDIITSYALPSILGEGFIVFGRFFFVFHAAFIASISRIAVNLYSRRSYLVFYAYFIAIRALAMGRGGSQGYLSTIINSAVLLIFIETSDKYIKKEIW